MPFTPFEPVVAGSGGERLVGSKTRKTEKPRRANGDLRIVKNIFSRGAPDAARDLGFRIVGGVLERVDQRRYSA